MPQAQPELKKVRRPFRCPRRPTTDAETNVDPLVKYLDKRLFVQLNGSRKVIGVLRGYDVRLLPLFGIHGALYWRLRIQMLDNYGANNGYNVQVFLNVVLDDAVEEKAGGEKVRIGMVVCIQSSLHLSPVPPLSPLFHSISPSQR